METARPALSRWLPIIVFVVVAVTVMIWTSGALNAPPAPDPTGSTPASAPPNWVQGALFGAFAGFVGATLAWVAVRYPRR